MLSVIIILTMVHLCTTAVVDVKHNITTFAGNGNPTFSGDGVSATSSGMKPFNCQVLPSGDVIFADFDNHRVRKIDSQTGLMSTIAGTGSTNYNGDNQLATSANLNHPIGIFVSLSGSIYIAEYGNHRIRKIETNGLISTIAGKLNKIGQNILFIFKERRDGCCWFEWRLWTSYFSSN